MKCLHAAALLRPPSGIVNQMRWEHQAAKELGIDWDVKLYCPSGWICSEEFIEESINVISRDPVKVHPIDWIRFRLDYYRWLLTKIDQYDVFVLRYYVHDPFQLMFVEKCRKPVYFVHHTFEEPELRLPGTFFSKARAVLDHLFGVPAIKRAHGIIGVTEEIVEYELKRAGNKNKETHIYPNGIRFDQAPLPDMRGKVPELLFVASYFASWHGLDLLLNSIESSTSDFRLHLVGEVPEPELTRARSDNRIIVHGQLSSKEIRKIAERCWVGLSSFALHRKGMKEACTLKVREYLMMGLPVYLGHTDVIPADAWFLCSGVADIDNIIRFARLSCADRRRVALDSKQFISKAKLLKKLYSEIKYCYSWVGI